MVWSRYSRMISRSSKGHGVLRSFGYAGILIMALYWDGLTEDTVAYPGGITHCLVLVRMFLQKVSHDSAVTGAPL